MILRRSNEEIKINIDIEKMEIDGKLFQSHEEMEQYLQIIVKDKVTREGFIIQ